MEVTIDGGDYSHHRHREIPDPVVECYDWAAQYQEYLDEKIAVETSTTGVDGGVKGDGGVMDVIVEVEDWAVQYAQYCDGKEREFFGTRGGNVAEE
jgi:hypothetical protein